jgi:hypothetical protein
MRALEEAMRRILSLTLLVFVGIGSSIASAQVKEPTDPRIHGVIGVITMVSRTSITLRADNGERELKIDQSTRVVNPKRSLTNDLVLRMPAPGITQYVKVGDEAQVSYRDNDGVLTAVAIRVSPTKTNK